VSAGEMTEDIKKLPGNLLPISHNYEKNSYVIQDKNARKLIGEVKETLAVHNVYLLGRFAEWEYYNMDKAIEAAMNLAAKI
jgi:UDP-galactopyranose mutase